MCPEWLRSATHPQQLPFGIAKRTNQITRSEPDASLSSFFSKALQVNNDDIDSTGEGNTNSRERISNISAYLPIWHRLRHSFLYFMWRKKFYCFKKHSEFITPHHVIWEIDHITGFSWIQQSYFNLCTPLSSTNPQFYHVCLNRIPYLCFRKAAN